MMCSLMFYFHIGVRWYLYLVFIFGYGTNPFVVNGGHFRIFVYFNAQYFPPSSILTYSAIFRAWRCFVCNCVVPGSGVGSGADDLLAVGRPHVRNRRPHSHGWGRDTAARYHSKGEITLVYIHVCLRNPLRVLTWLFFTRNCVWGTLEWHLINFQQFDLLLFVHLNMSDLSIHKVIGFENMLCVL